MAAGRAVEGLNLRNSLGSTLGFFSSFEAEITGFSGTSLQTSGTEGGDLDYKHINADSIKVHMQPLGDLHICDV